MTIHTRWLLVVLAFLASVSCSKGASNDASKTEKAVEAPVTSAPTPTPAPPAAPASNISGASISIASLTPDPSQPLRSGSKVKLKAEVNYVLPPQGGMIGMVIQGGSDTKPIGSTLKPVSGGSGKFATEIDFVVPNAKNVVVHMPLYVKGESKSVRVINKQYEVK